MTVLMHVVWCPEWKGPAPAFLWYTLYIAWNCYVVWNVIIMYHLHFWFALFVYLMANDIAITNWCIHACGFLFLYLTEHNYDVLFLSSSSSFFGGVVGVGWGGALFCGVFLFHFAASERVLKVVSVCIIAKLYGFLFFFFLFFFFFSFFLGGGGGGV